MCANNATTDDSSVTSVANGNRLPRTEPGDVVQCRGPAAGQHHLPAVGGQRQRGRRADPAAGAGDHRDSGRRDHALIGCGLVGCGLIGCGLNGCGLIHVVASH